MATLSGCLKSTFIVQLNSLSQLCDGNYVGSHTKTHDSFDSQGIVWQEVMLDRGQRITTVGKCNKCQHSFKVTLIT